MSDKAKKKIVVDQELCIGCGTCEGIAPKYFKIEDGISVVTGEWNEEDKELIEETIDNCPVLAIKVVEEEEKK